MNITCTVCQTNLLIRTDKESISTTNCGHVYHYQCILQWMERSKTCPQCRMNLTEDNIFKLNLHTDEAVPLPTPEDSINEKKIVELENRVEQLSIAESELKNQLDVKCSELRDLEKNNRNLSLAYEQLRKKNVELEARILELSNTASNLRNRLAIKKNEESREMKDLEEDYTNAIISAVQANTELRAKNAGLENQVKLLLEAKIALKNDLDMKNITLQETEENCASANLFNEDLRKKNLELENRVKQHLKVVLDLEKKLEQKQIGLQEEEENLTFTEANLSGEELRKWKTSRRQRSMKVKNWMDGWIDVKPTEPKKQN